LAVDLADSGSVFSATAELDGDLVTVQVTGEVDMATADAMFQAATRHRAAGLLLDLRGVTFFDSAALRAVIRLAERFPGSLTVLPSPQVQRVLEISGLLDQPWVRQP
jgi:stage II sporulation protein AA (anti-sigma F factor antagonist)